MIVVVNKHTHKPLPGSIDIYIGRGSDLGNPYTHRGHRQTMAKYIVNDRETACLCYRNWLDERLKNYDSAQSTMMRRIVKLAKTSDVNLVCFCAPQVCHGDYVKLKAEERIAHQNAHNSTT